MKPHQYKSAPIEVVVTCMNVEVTQRHFRLIVYVRGIHLFYGSSV